MKQLFTFLVLFTVVVSTHKTKAQTLQSTPVNIVNNINAHPNIAYANGDALGKTGACGVDTVYYTYNKTTAFNGLSLNTATSGNSFAQWYPADQPITVGGFDFYAWQSTNPPAGGFVTLTCRMYAAGFDSLPTGSPLASVTVNVDSTFGGGVLTSLRKSAVFANPVTTNVPYVLTVETSSATNVSVLANNWNATPTPNGRSEWLSSVKIGPTYFRGYAVNVGGPIFNADFIFQPYVSYSLDANFTISDCNSGNNTITFTNTSSPVLFSRFYNLRAFYNITYTSCLWNYGDSSGTWYTVNGNRMYNYAIPYNVTLKDTMYGWRTGCVDSKISIVGATPQSPASSNNSPLCVGATLKLYADTIANATYYWTGPNGFTSTQQNPTLTGIGVAAIGNYLVKAIVNGCSSAVSSTYVNVITNASASSNAPICVGQTLNLSATSIAGAVYAWTGPNGFVSSLATPSKSQTTSADSGTYQVTITLAGCGTLGPFNVISAVNAIPVTPVVSSNSPLCVGDNLNLTASNLAGGTYSWSGPNNFTTNQQNPSRANVNGSFAGTYNVTVTYNGCTSPSVAATVVINNIPSAPTAGNNGPLCTGQSLSLTATTVSGASYSWSGPNGFTSTTQNPVRSNLTTLDAGAYSVVATVNGCASATANTSVAITTLTPTPVASSNGPLCPGQNFQLSASTIPGATYSWIGPNNFTSTVQNPSITNVSSIHAGIYEVTATTSGCGTSSQGNTTLVINSLPAAPSVGNNGPVCDGSTINLTASTITGATYHWTGVNGFSSSDQNPSIASANASKMGDYQVYVTVTGCGTSGTVSTFVKTNRIPATPSATSSGAVCLGDSIKLNGTAINVGPNATYAWSGPNNFSSTLANSFVSSANSSHGGTYNLIVTDSGCSSAAAGTSVNIKLTPAAPTASSNAPICEGANLLLTATAVNNASYAWQGPNNYTATSQNPILVSATAAASGSYEVVAIVNGCKSLANSTTVLINVLPAKPVVTNNSPKCVGETINLSATSSANVNYSWNGPNGFSSTLQAPSISNATQNNAGDYYVIAASATCASLQTSTTVVINKLPDAPTLTSNPANGMACVGDSVQLFASFLNGGTYTWTGPAGFGSTMQRPTVYNASTANTGQYSATVTKDGCVSAAANISLTVSPVPNTGDIDGENVARRTETKTYSVVGPLTSTYAWSTTGGGAIVSGNGTSSVNVRWGNINPAATVKVTETNASGCKGLTKTLTVDVTSAIGLDKLSLAGGNVMVYPNPANSFVYLNFDLPKSALTQVKLINMLGQTIVNQNKMVLPNEKMLIDVSNLNAGVYFVDITVDGETKIQRVVVY